MRGARHRRWANCCGAAWHPVGLVADAADIPRKVRVPGEDLVLFRG